MTRSRTGGQILVDQLALQNVQHVFCVPGESYLAVLDALHDATIPVTVCRQEGGAAMMAEAHGKLTGRPGVCFVTRGPGATNASPGIHIACQDSTPLIVFVGQIERRVREREALQELDYRAVFGSLTKWVTEIDSASRIPEIVSRAFHIATSGRPGPVVIALPEDMLVESTTVADALPALDIETHPGQPQMLELARIIKTAKKPVAILGGSRWSAEAVQSMAEFAGRFKLPVAVSLRRQMLFPTDHPSFIGDLGFGPNPKLVQHVREADLILAIGGRLSEAPSQGYTLLDIPVPASTWIHRFYRFRQFGTQLAPTSGSMGYGVPAGVAAKRLFPDRTVVIFAGDGDFLMNGQEFATAVQYDVPIVVIVVDNGMYGTIRMHQERDYPGRVSATQLRNPDFAAYGRAFGGHGERVEKTEEFAPAFERAIASGKPAIVHCLIDPEAISPSTTLSAIRENALSRQRINLNQQASDSAPAPATEEFGDK